MAVVRRPPSIGNNDDLVFDLDNLKQLFSMSPSSQPTSRIKVMQISAGNRHMAAVTTDSRVFTCGDGVLGQLGLGEEIRISSMFAEVDPVHFRSSVPHDRPIMVSCGRAFCATLTTAGEVFTWGDNCFESLGLGLCQLHLQFKPQRVNFENVATSRLCMISCNNRHTIALGSEGELYAWGADVNGQLGLGPESKNVRFVGVPQKVWHQGSDKQKFVFVSAGWHHSSAVTEEGRVYMWGAGGDGQLGLGIGTWPKVFPTRVTGLIEREHVVMTSCGERHTLALTDDGRLWSTGCGREGQLSIGIENMCRHSFGLVQNNGFLDKRVITATAGDGHSTAVREDGAVFTWGAGYSSHVGIENIKYLKKNAIGKMQPEATRYAMITRGDILAFVMGTHERLARKDPNSISPLYQLSEMTEILKMIWDAGRIESLPSHITPHHEGLVLLIGGGLFD
jgi:hypothetical protein